jgi:hypothetical protein
MFKLSGFAETPLVEHHIYARNLSDVPRWNFRIPSQSFRWPPNPSQAFGTPNKSTTYMKYICRSTFRKKTEEIGVQAKAVSKSDPVQILRSGTTTINDLEGVRAIFVT